MVRLTRLNHTPFVLNSDLIEHIEETPDTVITLTTGQILRVRETPDQVIQLIVDFVEEYWNRQHHASGYVKKRYRELTSMAESAGKKQSKTRKGAGRKADMATWGGIALALIGILGGLVLEKGSIWEDMMQGTAAMIVLGGTFGAVLVTTPLPVFTRAMSRLGAVFFQQPNTTSKTIDELIHYASEARKNGIVSLEGEAAAISDPFFRKALSLAVDGTDLQEIRKMMEIDINLTEEASEAEAKVWEAAGGYAPTVGIIGAVMGLIQVMKHLEDIQAVGHGIAVAFVATVYGVGSANIFFLPAGNKLRARMHEAAVIKEMILEGVIGIVEGLNPTLIRMKLEAFDPHPVKPKKIKTAAPARSATPAGTGRQPQPSPADR